MPKKHFSEFGINMYLDRIAILQQQNFNLLSKTNYFSKEDPCHIYFVGMRPRISIDIDNFKVDKKEISFQFKIQDKDRFKIIPFVIPNDTCTTNIEIKSEYPYTYFDFYFNDQLNLQTNAAIYLQHLMQHHNSTPLDCLDLDILYIGQSFGQNGERQAPERLLSHSTLQGIYAEAISKNPDNEIWIALTSFKQINLMAFNGRGKYTDGELKKDNDRFSHVFNKLNYEGINEQQKINFTEAALIKYFQPPYNKIYKDSFPNPAHITYSECYDLDINSICIELDTYDKTSCRFYSEKTGKKIRHMEKYSLHSREIRLSMFCL